MGDNSLLVQKNIQEFTEFIEAIPYLKNDSYNFKNFIYEESLEYKQALLNSFLSIHYIKDIFSLAEDKINLKNIKYYVRNKDVNLLMNIREKFFENTFRYVSGYIPQSVSSNCYYLYSSISPTKQYKDEFDFCFVNVEYYGEYFIPSELVKMKFPVYLITIPIFLKHFHTIKKYLYDIKQIKKALIDILQQRQCDRYVSMISALDETNEFDFKYIEKESQWDYFHILYAFYLQKTLQLQTLNINAYTRSYMFYNIVSNKHIDNLPFGFPEVIRNDNFEFNNTTNHFYENKSIYDPTDHIYEEVYDSIPNPPPLPKLNPKFNVLNKDPVNNIKKYDYNEDFKPERIITFPADKLSDFLKQKDKPMTPQNKFLNELRNKFKSMKNYFGGDIRDYDNDKIVRFDTPENADYISNVIELDNLNDYDVEKNAFNFAKVSTVNRQPNVNSMTKLTELLFSNLSNFEMFSQTNFYQKKLVAMYEFIKQDKNLGFITYEFKTMFFNLFVISDNNNELRFLHLYNNYFAIIKEYLNFLNSNTNSIFYMKDNFILLGALILKQLDIFSLYTTKKVIPFRHYMVYYYQLLKLINKERTSSVSLFSTLLNILNTFQKSIIEPLIGGSHSFSTNMFEPTKFERLNFFHYSYLLDVLTHLEYGNGSNSDFYKVSINDDKKNNEIYKFYDGIELNEFLQLNPNQQYVLSVVNKIMFIGDLASGTKMLFKKSDVQKNVRVCFIVKQLTYRYNAYDLIKELSNIIKNNNINVHNLEEFLYKFNILIDNVKLNDLLRRLDKIKSPKEAPLLLSYYKNINDKNDKLYKNSLIELFLFLFYFLVKLGFDVSHYMTKSNLIINITPELNEENILQYLNENNNELSQISKQLLEENKELLDFIINSTTCVEINNDLNTGGAGIIKGSKIVFKLPYSLNILEKSISDNILNLYENENHIDSEVLSSQFDNIFEKEHTELQDNLDILISANKVNVDNLYKIIPNYIILQTELAEQYPVLENKSILNNEDSLLGGNSTNPNHPLKIFLDKYQNENISSTIPPIPKEYIEKNIDMILQEQYFKTLDRLVLFYDNKLLADKKYNTNSLILRDIMNSVEYLRKYYKIDFTNNIKNGIVSLVTLIQKVDECIYQIFVVIQYIKHFIIYMYKKLGINFDEYKIDTKDFSIFYKIIEPRFKERSKYMKQIFDININTSLNKLDIKAIPDTSAYEEINMDTLNEEFFTSGGDSNDNIKNDTLNETTTNDTLNETSSNTQPSITGPTLNASTGNNVVLNDDPGTNIPKIIINKPDYNLFETLDKMVTDFNSN